jgi:hypothetical protein
VQPQIRLSPDCLMCQCRSHRHIICLCSSPVLSFAAQKPWFCYLVINTHISVNSCILFSTSCLLSSCFCRHYLVSWITGTKCFDMILKFSWGMICIMVLPRTNVLESCCILISMVHIARCEILMMVVLRIRLLCDAALLCEWSVMFLRGRDFWKECHIPEDLNPQVRCFWWRRCGMSLKHWYFVRCSW